MSWAAVLRVTTAVAALGFVTPERSAVAAPALHPPKVEPVKPPPPARAKGDDWLKVDRIIVSLTLLGDAGHLSGEQWINQFRNDESFDMRMVTLSPSASVMFRPSERFRFGPELRFVGVYESTQGNAFTFGPLFELSGRAEYSLPILEHIDLVFAGQLGFAFLFAGGDLASEISRLQNQGARLWGGPFLGGVALVGLGLRRPIVGPLALRLQFDGGAEHLFLLADDETISGLHVIKKWSADVLRLGITLGLEVVF